MQQLRRAARTHLGDVSLHGNSDAVLGNVGGSHDVTILQASLPSLPAQYNGTTGGDGPSRTLKAARDEISMWWCYRSRSLRWCLDSDVNSIRLPTEGVVTLRNVHASLIFAA